MSGSRSKKSGGKYDSPAAKEKASKESASKSGLMKYKAEFEEMQTMGDEVVKKGQKAMTDK